MPNRDTVKQWFLSRKKPTQAQYHALFDYLFFKDEGVAIANVTDLSDTLEGKASVLTVNALAAAVLPEHINPVPNANFSYTYLAGVRGDGMVFIPSVDMTIRIGTVADAEDIVADIDIEAGEENCIDFKVSALTANKTIYINGITGSVDVYVYKR